MLRHSKLLSSLIFSTAIIFLSPSPTTSATDAPISFAEKITAFQNHKERKPADWFSQESPWHPFLKRQFSEGLTPEETEKSLKAQKTGLCQTVIDLEILGFQRLYPDWAQALKMKSVRQSFVRDILPHHAPSLIRCNAHKILKSIIAKAKAEGPEYFPYNLPFGETDEKFGRIVSAGEKKFRSVFTRLKRLAFCRYDKLAILDLFEIKARWNRSDLGPREFYYLLKRAEQLGIKVPDADRRRREFSHEINPFVLARMRAAFESGDIDQAQNELRWIFVICHQA